MISSYGVVVFCCDSGDVAAGDSSASAGSSGVTLVMDGVFKFRR